MSIEKLSDEERFWINRFHGCSLIDKALRIIDALTEQVTRLNLERDEARSQYAILQTSIDMLPPDRLRERVKELTASMGEASQRALESYNRRIHAESELAQMRERVAKALRELTSPPMYSAKQRCAEALRGS